GVELEELVQKFAEQQDLQVNEACKALVALAVTAMDVRYYGLISQMAEKMGGVNAFVRACARVHVALEGAMLATGRPLEDEPERSLFILKVVRDFLAARDIQVQTQDL